MKAEIKVVPKEVVEELKLKEPPKPSGETKAIFYYEPKKEKGKEKKLKFVRINLPTHIVKEMNLTDKSRLSLVVETDINKKEKYVIVRVVK
jgi:hypothetical protein